MNKDNVFRSSNFHMDEGDELNMIIIDESGTQISMFLYNVNDSDNPEDGNGPDIFNDWFLPSKDELNAIYVELKLFGIGGIDGSPRWSSTEHNATQANMQTFSDGSQSVANKDYAIRVRAVRAFTSVMPSYSLRDIGPSGGWIFYKSGDNYMEAAASDLVISAWSNIISNVIGAAAQGTAIGTGNTNTTAIIGQLGHTQSAALECYNFIVT